MPNVEVNCGNCGSHFPVAEELAGLIATCPGCGRQISVPLPASLRRPGPALQVRHEAVISGGRKCPRCGAQMDDEAVLCVHCGLDLRADASASGPAISPKVIRTSLVAVGVVLVVILAWVFLQRRNADSGVLRVPAPARSATMPVSSGTNAASMLTSTNAAAAANMDTQTLASAATATVASVAGAREDAARAQADIEYRAVMKKRLDEKYPMYTRGASVVLRRMNGQVHRGVLTELRKDAVVIVAAGNAVVQIPLAALDSPSRLRCDKAFRDRYTDLLAKRRVQQPAVLP